MGKQSTLGWTYLNWHRYQYRRMDGLGIVWLEKLFIPDMGRRSKRGRPNDFWHFLLVKRPRKDAQGLLLPCAAHHQSGITPIPCPTDPTSFGADPGKQLVGVPAALLGRRLFIFRGRGHLVPGDNSHPGTRQR